MSRFEDFAVGQHVAHVNCGDGIVDWVDRDGLHVIYDRETNGVRWRGIYNRRWFEINPNLLSLRSAS